MALTVLAGLGASAGTARAYVRTRTEAGVAMKWDHRLIPLQIFTGSPTYALDADLITRAGVAAAEPWSHDTLACSALTLAVTANPAVEDVVAPDRKNRVIFRRNTWCRNTTDTRYMKCYERSALAITSVWAETTTGRIIDADVEVNAVNYTWADLVEHPELFNENNMQDLQNALTHEFGHVIGLDHTCATDNPDDQGHAVPQSCATASDEIKETTMAAIVQPGDTARRTLADDDKRGACEIYPPGANLPLNEPKDDSGGCAYGGAPRSGSPAAWFGVVATAWWLSRKRTFIRR